MTEISWPSALPVRSFSLGLVSDYRAHAAQFGGSERVFDLLDDSWVATVGFEFTTRAQSAVLDVFLTQMSSGIKYVKLGHLARPVNRGTLVTTTGTLFAAPKGSDFITIQATAGLTLKAGDMLECAGLLLSVAFDCTAAAGNVMDVFLVNRLRKDIASFTAVNLSTPKAKFYMNSSAGLKYGMNFADGVSISLEEVI